MGDSEEEMTQGANQSQGIGFLGCGLLREWRHTELGGEPEKDCLRVLGGKEGVI